ncbi:6-phosphofructokinase [Chlamydiia bacterium]|nr:6-phosphofructokinase [Chlamydiia bacterium]
MDMTTIKRHIQRFKVTRFDDGARKPVDVKHVCCMFSGGPAPGGHNVIASLTLMMNEILPNTILSGARYGLKGLQSGDLMRITPDDAETYLNTGGFYWLGTSRVDVTDDVLRQVKKQICKHGIDVLVLIGGDGTHRLTQHLYRYFKAENIACRVLVVPKTIDGDIRFKGCGPSFGHDTAVRVYATLTQHIARDVLSTDKYYHVIRLMGRDTSHVTYHVCKETKPTVSIISELLKDEGWSFKQLVDYIADVMLNRLRNGVNSGLIVLPEGVISMFDGFKRMRIRLEECVQETSLFDEVDHAMQSDTIWTECSIDVKMHIHSHMRDNGVFSLTAIPFETLLIQSVMSRLPTDSGISMMPHFFGYEARCAPPSPFDAEYTVVLGIETALSICQGLSGYSMNVNNSDKASSQWVLKPIYLMNENVTIKQHSLDPYRDDVVSFIQAEKRYRDRHNYKLDSIDQTNCIVG